MQCCLEPYGQYCTKFLPVQCCHKRNWDNIEEAFFLCNVVWRLLSNIDQDIFLCNVVWSLLDNIAQSIYLCNVVPRVLRQHWTRFVSVQCCLEPLAPHCTKFLPAVQFCPKNINTTPNRIFTCALLSQEY